MKNNFLEIQDSVVLIKTTPYKKYIKKWFWHKRLGIIKGKSGLNKPYSSINHIQNCKEEVEAVDRIEMQVGDTCLVKIKDFNEPLVVHVIGVDEDQDLIFQSKSNEILKKLDITMHALISSNTRFSNKPPRPNIYNAKSEEELIFFEKIFYLSGLRKLKEEFGDTNFNISEENLKLIHRFFFEKLYDWAGKIRHHADQELVIGDRDHSTLEPLQVANELSNYFSTLPNPLLMHSSGTKYNLAVALADIHTKLAWIHPFMDGNGRTIRLFCYYIALKYNYILELEKSKHNNRSYYNFAIRCSLKGHPNHLINIIFKNLKEIDA